MEEKYKTNPLRGGYIKVIKRGRITIPSNWRKIMDTDQLEGYRKELEINSKSHCLILGEKSILEGLLEKGYSLDPDDLERIQIMNDLIENMGLDKVGRIQLRSSELRYLGITNNSSIALYGNIDRFIISKA